MSRSRTRARKRRARQQVITSRMDEFRNSVRSLLIDLRKAKSKWARIEVKERLIQLFIEIERKDLPLWSVAGELDISMPDEERVEWNAMISQIVAKPLAAMSPGSVDRRHSLGVMDE